MINYQLDNDWSRVEPVLSRRYVLVKDRVSFKLVTHRSLPLSHCAPQVPLSLSTGGPDQPCIDAQTDFGYCKTLKYYCHKVKHIFYTIPILEVLKKNLIFGFYSTCTLVFWLPNLDEFD